MLPRLRISRSTVLISTSAIVVFFAAAAHAQAPAPVRANETVVVTATGREIPQSVVGASVTVLGGEDIEQRRALSTIDLLRTVPGVIASRPGGVGNLTSVWVRGGESTYNKVLIDGIPLNEPGGTFNFASLAPENIGRIEILRGAHSALFGSDAMASVIQILSTRPEQDRPQGDVALDGGTYETAHIAAGAGARAGTFEYRVFVSGLHTDNRVPNNEHRMTTWSGSAGKRGASGEGIRLLIRGDLGRTGVPGATAFGRPDMDAQSKTANTDFLAGWDRPMGGRVLQRASYSFARSRQESINMLADPPFIAQFGSLRAPFTSIDFLYHLNNDLRRHHVDYRADVTTGSNQILTAAFAYDGERGVLTDHLAATAPQRPVRNSTATTVQYERTSGPVSLVGGVRFENNGSFGFHTVPRASMSWLASNGGGARGATRLHASAGLGIKEPTFLQSYSRNIFFLGNSDLEPERSRSYDAGLEQRFAGSRVRVDVTYFANRFDDLISLRTVDPTTGSSQYFNIGETRADGVELTGGATFRSVRVDGYYTFLDSKVVRSTSSSPIFAPGRRLFRRPTHSGSVQGTFVKSRFSATLGGLFVGERVDTDSASLGLTSNDGYVLVNATVDVRLTRRTSAFVTIDNLGLYDYMDPLGYLGLGRMIRGGIRTRF